MRKPPPADKKKTARKSAEPAAASLPVRTARAATEDELAALARAQQDQLSAESFWKSAGRLTKLR